jgi:hypothetical protein
VALLAVSGCATTRYARDDLDTLRVIDSKASAIYAALAGKVNACAVVFSKDGPGQVIKIIYKDGSCQADVTQTAKK